MPARAAVRWWQDPKLTFGPPGDPEFLAKIPHQVRLRPMHRFPQTGICTQAASVLAGFLPFGCLLGRPSRCQSLSSLYLIFLCLDCTGYSEIFVTYKSFVSVAPTSGTQVLVTAKQPDPAFFVQPTASTKKITYFTGPPSTGAAPGRERRGRGHVLGAGQRLRGSHVEAAQSRVCGDRRHGPQHRRRPRGDHQWRRRDGWEVCITSNPEINPSLALSLNSRMPPPAP